MSHAAKTAVDPASLTADSVFRELGHLSAVVRRAAGPDRQADRAKELLVHLAVHEGALEEGFATRWLTQVEVADMLGIRPQSVGPILVQLESEGLIERVAWSGDRRARLVKLTDAGRLAAAEARERQRAFAEQALSVLSEEERAGFAAAIVKLNATLG